MVLDEIVMCVPHVIGEKVLAQQMAHPNRCKQRPRLNGSEDAAALAHRSPLFSQPQEKDVFIFIHNSKHLIPLNPNPSDNTTGHIVAPQKMACGCDESFHLA
ncbi:hypothetical protein CCL23_23510 [Pseudomonas syringae]|nr:hypothetical protein CCL23_23510 [Pseudomonas syringae]